MSDADNQVGGTGERFSKEDQGGAPGNPGHPKEEPQEQDNAGRRQPGE